MMEGSAVATHPLPTPAEQTNKFDVEAKEQGKQPARPDEKLTFAEEKLPRDFQEPPPVSSTPQMDNKHHPEEDEEAAAAPKPHLYRGSTGKIMGLNNDAKRKLLQRGSARAAGEASYVPLALAREHLGRAARDMAAMKDRHLVVVRRLDASYKQIEADTREHYVAFIQGLRAKALRHNDYQKKLINMMREQHAEYRREMEEKVASLEEVLAQNLAAHRRDLKKAAEEKERLLREKEAALAAQKAAYERELKGVRAAAETRLQRAHAAHAEEAARRAACGEALLDLCGEVAAAVGEEEARARRKAQVAERWQRSAAEAKDRAAIEAAAQQEKQELEAAARQEKQELEAAARQEKQELEAAARQEKQQLEAAARQEKQQLEAAARQEREAAAAAAAGRAAARGALEGVLWAVEAAAAAEAVAAAKELEVRATSLASRLGNEEGMVGRLQGELDSARRQHAVDTTKIQELEEELEETKAELDQLNDELTRRTCDFSEMEKKLAASNANVQHQTERRAFRQFTGAVQLAQVAKDNVTLEEGTAVLQVAAVLDGMVAAVETNALVENATGRQANLKKQTSQLKQTNAAQGKEIEGLRAELGAAREGLAARDADLRAARAEAEEARAAAAEAAAAAAAASEGGGGAAAAAASRVGAEVEAGAAAPVAEAEVAAPVAGAGAGAEAEAAAPVAAAPEAEVAAGAGGPPAPLVRQGTMMRQTEALIAKLLAEIDELTGKKMALAEELKSKTKEKKAKKQAIKVWMSEFEQKEGRPPEKEDKEQIKDQFVAHKKVDARLKDIKGEQEKVDTDYNEKSAELEAAQKRLALANADSQPQEIEHGTAEESQSKKAFVVPPGQALAVADPAVVKENDTLKTTVADLERQIKDLQEKVAAKELELEQQRSAQGLLVAEEELAGLQAAAKEAARLRGEASKLREDAAAAAEEADDARAKLEAALEEGVAGKTALRRARRAEEEARARAGELEEEVAALRKPAGEDSELGRLRQKVEKLQAELKAKGQAATAGWDVAAEAEDKLEVEVERARKEGYAEARGELEARRGEEAAAAEARVRAELGPQVAEAEGRAARLREELTAARRELAAAAAARQQRASEGGAAAAPAPAAAALDGEAEAGGAEGGGGGGAGSEETAGLRARVGDLEAEADELRDELAAAEAALAASRARGEKLEATAAAALAELEKSSSAAAAAGAESARSLSPPPGRGRAAGGATEKYQAALEDLEATTTKGSALWKSGDRQGCQSLYQQKAEELIQDLPRGALRKILEDVHRANKNAPSNGRAGPVYRKAFNAFMERAREEVAKGSPSPGTARRKSLEGSGGGGGDGPAKQQSSEALAALKEQMEAIQKEEPPAATASRPPRGGGGSGGGGDAALERKVRALERKLRAAEEALAAATEEEAAPAGGTGAATQPGRPGGAGAADTRKLEKQLKEVNMKLRKAEAAVAKAEEKAERAAAQGGGGDGGKAAEIKLQKLEKKHKKDLEELQKKLGNEADKATRKATKLETEKGELEGELKEAKETIKDMKKKVASMGTMGEELEKLRERSAEADEMERQLKVNAAEVAELEQKYKDEQALRKKYWNMMEDMKGKIRVYARCRPMAKYELERGCQQAVRFVDETTIEINSAHGPKQFVYDAVFSPANTQEDVFEDTKNLMQSCLDGYNVCLFAYGQTGSGKTFTMTGSDAMPGVTPRGIRQLYGLIEQNSANLDVTVSTYFVELYNDGLVDLYWSLDHDARREQPPKLDIKLDAKKMVFIKNVTLRTAASADELLSLFDQGNANRHVGATAMNAESSRSHSIFAILIESYNKTTKKTATGKLSLVDLAGSERADKTGATADRLREAQNINKSLSALGDVISALSTNQKFIPYRNNKLTQLMQDSLGGNAKTLMFVNLSPADYNQEESLTSLMYAARVKLITNTADKNTDNEEIAKLKAIIRNLKAGGTGEIGGDEGDDGAEEEKA